MTTLEDRFRGLMVGTAVGDCLGRPVEGHRSVGEAYLTEVVTNPPSLIYTDDTAMTLKLAESLVESNGFDGSDMAMRFATEFRDDPNRGYGGGVARYFEAVLSGARWHVAAEAQFDGEGSYGNGGAMRVAPVALWAYSDLDETARLAGESARVTHTHPIGVEGAVVQAVAAHHALNTPDDGEFDVVALLADLDRLVETDQFRDKLTTLDRFLEEGDDEKAALHLGNWVAADKSVVTALYCFLMAGDFEEAILRALRIAGDTDTIGAMTGALAGARFGLTGIPKPWLGVEGHDRLVELADALASRTGP